MAIYYAAQSGQIEAANTWYSNRGGTGSPTAFSSIQTTDTLDSNGKYLHTTNQSSLHFAKLQNPEGGSFVAINPSSLPPLTLEADLEASTEAVLFAERSIVLNGNIVASGGAMGIDLEAGAGLTMVGDITVTFGAYGILTVSNSTISYIGNILTSGEMSTGISINGVYATLVMHSGTIESIDNSWGITVSSVDSLTLEDVSLIQNELGLCILGPYTHNPEPYNTINIAGVVLAREPQSWLLPHGAQYGASVGELYIPRDFDVRKDTPYGGSGGLGTCAIPTPDKVLKGQLCGIVGQSTYGTVPTLPKVGPGGLIQCT